MKKCPFCAEEIQNEAIVCRFCGRDLIQPINSHTTLPQNTITNEQPIAPPVQKKQPVALVLILVIIFVCMIGFALSNQSGNSNSSSSGPDKFDAYAICQQFVEQNLKAPSTAKFPSTSSASITNLSGPTWLVVSYVDAENSFGAKIRSDFTCRVEHQGGDKWKLVDMKID